MNNDPFELSNLMDEKVELIPLLTPEDEQQMNAEQMPKQLPVLPLRNTVLFPGVVFPITVGRDRSIKLVQDAYESDKMIGVVAQLNGEIEFPNFDQLHKVGTIARLVKILKMPDGNTTVIIQGIKRFRLAELVKSDPYFIANIEAIDDQKPQKNDQRFEALFASIKDLAINMVRLSPNIPSEAANAIKNIESPAFLIHFIASNISASVVEKQELLETTGLQERANLLLGHLAKELKMLEIKKDIHTKVRTDIDSQQREYFLQQQMKQIQQELGGNTHDEQLKNFKEKASKKKWAVKVKETFDRELEKIQRMNQASAEYSVHINYLETLIELPWDDYTKDKFDLREAGVILDRDHYGMEKVKERILEHLAVLKLKGDMKAPILCLVGPPGVGKTSLGKSVAEALGRNYIRMSLGGLHDEAEIRGHRKTYIGAMPGRILQSLKKAKSSNPVFVLDEVDKMGKDFRGDPASALLEVLDPEQNSTFYDNFIELEYDLSKVMFIATANTLSSILPALRDRLEVIELSGYTIEEKIEIAKRHLIPKQLKEHGLKSEQVDFTNDVLEKLVEQYTLESGVRLMEKQLAKIMRQVAKLIVMKEKYNLQVTQEDVLKYLGPGITKDRLLENESAGVVNGLAWTAFGGDVLFIEASLTSGKGKLTLTGNLGDVMKESAVIALQYLNANAGLLGLKPEMFAKHNVHIHVPEGATPKDGPSAGITMMTALASAFTGRKAKPRIAMTGEITLRGKVLPVGGIKEKILAAKRMEITDIILSENNRPNVEEIEQKYRDGMNFHYVTKMIDVIDLALKKPRHTGHSTGRGTIHGAVRHFKN